MGPADTPIPGDGVPPDPRVRVLPSHDGIVSEPTIPGAAEVPFFSTADRAWDHFKGQVDVVCGGGSLALQNAQVKCYATIGSHTFEVRRRRGHVLDVSKPTRVLRLRDVVADKLEFVLLGNAVSLAANPGAFDPSFFAISGVGVEADGDVEFDTRFVGGNGQSLVPPVPPALSSAGTLVTFDTLLFELRVSVVTFPAPIGGEGGPLPSLRWLQLFDKATAAIAGDVAVFEWLFATPTIAPISGGVPESLFTWPQDGTFSWRERQTPFDLGLQWAWSSTPFALTPALDVTSRVDAEVY
jgi:hypothetical protein